MKELIKNKYMYIIVVGLLLIVTCICLGYKYTHISDLEHDLFVEQSNVYMNYYDTIETGSGLDSYMLYALTYSDNENDESKLTVNEIVNILGEVFEKEFSLEEISNVGITPLFMDYGIMQNYDNNEYYIDKESLTQSKIANIKIYIYNIKSLKKRGNSYITLYEKYEIENPYDVLNYYNDKGIDTTKINDYLRTKGKVKDVKESVDEEYLKNNAKKLSDVKIEYVLKGTKFHIK